MWDVNLEEHEDDLGRADVVATLQRMFFTRVTIRIINKHRQRIAKQMLAVKQTPAKVSSFSSSLASSCASSPFTSSSCTPSSYTPSSCTPSSSFSSSSSHYASGASSPTSYTSNDFLDEILEATVLHPRNIRFPVARDYQLLFLDFVESLMTRDHVTTDQKVKLQQLKDSLKETDETGHHEHGHGRHGRNGGHSYKTYIHPQSLHPITLLESATYVDEAFGTTGLASTTASFILSDWIRLHPEFFRGKNVLELGCGCGLAGITTVAACQPKNYTFTDYHAKVMTQCRENVELNFQDEENEIIKFKTLDWMTFDANSWKDESVDVILGCDIVYSLDLIPSLAHVIKSLLIAGRRGKRDSHRSTSDTSPVAIFISAVRDQNTLAFFILCLKNFNLVVDDIPEEDDGWQFPDRDYYNASDRESDFRMLIIKDASCTEENQMFLGD